MIQEYFYAIIISIIILTAIVIYFLTRKFKQDEENYIDNSYYCTSDNTDEQNKKENNLKIPFEENKTIENENPYILRTEEEGSFGNIKNNPFEEGLKTQEDTHSLRNI